MSLKSLGFQLAGTLCLCPRLRRLNGTHLVRTGVVRGITASQALWGEGRKSYRQILTPPTRASVMANAKCRSCGLAADAGAHCSSCAAAITAKALNPFFGGPVEEAPSPRAARGIQALHSTTAFPIISSTISGTPSGRSLLKSAARQRCFWQAR